MPIDRNLKRRLFLYGAGAAIALLALAGPRIVKWIVPPVKVASWDLEASVADEAGRLLV